MLAKQNKFLLVSTKVGEVTLLVGSVGKVVAWRHRDQGSSFGESNG